MSGGKVVAICQFGGEFVSNIDGSMSYTGGEAHAIDIDRDMLLDDFKSEITSMFNIDISTMSIKYFLPNNKRTLITISSDKDLQRMVDFHADSATTDVYILNKVNNRETRSIVADSGTSIVATATSHRNVRPHRLSNADRVASRATRTRITVADDTPKVSAGATADSGRQQRPTAPEEVDNRTVAVDSSTAIIATPDIGDVRQQGLIAEDKVDNRETGSPVAASSTQFVGNISSLKSTSPWDNVITGVGQEFDNVRDFRDELRKYAIGKDLAYKFIKNDHTRVTAKCTMENCPWRIHASWSACKKKIVIRKLNHVHSCGGGTSKTRRTTRQWLANILMDKLRDTPQYKPKEIARDLFRDYGISLNYSQAWHGKEVAQKELHNLQEEAFNRLPWFCDRILETNPGSVAMLATSVDSKFRRFFVSFHASLHGFEQGCRPLLFLDRIPLKANNQWKLLAVASVDGDDDIFPVAFAAVEAETYDSWLWFLIQLKYAVTTSRTITFISNRHKGLEEAVHQVFEDSYHSYCLLQLVEDFKAELNKGSWSQEAKDEMVDDFRHAARACIVEDFNAHIENIRNVSREAADWVMASKPEHWSNALFRGSRYDHFSSNILESISTWIPVKHESSVVQMVDAIRDKMMEVIHARRETSNTWTATLTPNMEKKLQKEIPKAHTFTVLCSSETVFEVRGNTVNVVNIGSWECTCRRWQITGLPCTHAIAVFDRIDRSTYDYCSRYFRSESYRLTYSESIQPIPDVESISSIFRANVYPPPSNRPPDRRRRKRINPHKTIIRPLHCSRCKVAGHNKATCEASM